MNFWIYKRISTNHGHFPIATLDYQRVSLSSIVHLGVSENSVPLNPRVLLIIIPIKWLFHWEYTLFSDKPIYASKSHQSQLPLRFQTCYLHPSGRKRLRVTTVQGRQDGLGSRGQKRYPWGTPNVDGGRCQCPFRKDKNQNITDVSISGGFQWCSYRTLMAIEVPSLFGCSDDWHSAR